MNKFFMLNMEDGGEGSVTVALLKLNAPVVSKLLLVREAVAGVGAKLDNDLSGLATLDEFVLDVSSGSLLSAWWGEDEVDEVDDHPDDNGMNELRNNGFLEITEEFYDNCCSDVPTEYERLHADRYGVYWSAYLDETNIRIKTSYFPWDDLLKLRLSFGKAPTASAEG